jgi:hypothetical protein
MSRFDENVAFVMQITRSSVDSRQGPADWFTGDVYIDAVAAPEATSTSPCSRTTNPAAPSPGANT